MDLGNPVITALVGLVIFYIGLKTFSGGMKAMGNMDHLNWFLGNPIYMFLGGIIMTLAWQSSSLSTTAIIGIPILLASETAIDSLFTSITNSASGNPPSSLTPPIAFCNLSISLSKMELS